MSSHVIAQTDEDTFFVLVEDTVSLQSYDSCDKYTNDVDFPDAATTAATGGSHHHHNDEQTIAFESDDGLNQHFINEIMSAMEEDQLYVYEQNVNKQFNGAPSEQPHSIRNENKGTLNNGGSSSNNEDTVSITSRNSQFSNKSFVFVPLDRLNASLSPGIIFGDNENMNDTNESEFIPSLDDSSTMDQSGDLLSVDGLRNFEHPSLEYDDSWQLCREASVGSEEPHKVLIRELSYDSLKDVDGVDLMAPVFLAITGEAGDHVTDMKRKSKSIEDLCSVTLNDDASRRRTRSDVSFKQKLKSNRYLKANQCTNLNKVVDTEELDTSLDEPRSTTLTLSRNASIKSHISFDDLRLSTTSSGVQYNGERGAFPANELFEDPDVYIDDVYEEVASSDLSGGELLSLTYPSDIEETDSIKSGSWKEIQPPCDNASSGDDEILETAEQSEMFKYKEKKGDLKRSPRCVPGSQCGFLEYPYGERSPLGSPHKVRRIINCNTMPDSPAPSGGGLRDRIVVNVNGEQRIIDMHLIEPYLKVLSHGGHHRIGDECRDIVVFAACFLPDKTMENYTIIMEQLFFYCIHAVDLLVTDSYEIIFFNSALESKNMPARKWIKQYYDLVFYRLKKNLKEIYFVHQSLWLKAALRFSKLFVSSKFRRKIHLIQNIQTLKKSVPLDYIFIPDNITKVDETFQ